MEVSIIVIAWTDTEMVHDGKTYPRDLGAAPRMRPVTVARAVTWALRGDSADVRTAHEYAEREDARREPGRGPMRVCCYHITEADPLARAKRAVMEG